jgi:putative endonuclease
VSKLASPHPSPHPEVHRPIAMPRRHAPQTLSFHIQTMSGAWVYILKCADGSYYTGLTRQELPEAREQQHNEGTFPDAYTWSRRPVKLVYAEYLELVIDAIEAERKIKGWSRAKKEALIARDWDRVQKLAKRRGGNL